MDLLFASLFKSTSRFAFDVPVARTRVSRVHFGARVINARIYLQCKKNMETWQRMAQDEAEVLVSFVGRMQLGESRGGCDWEKSCSFLVDATG